MPTRAFIDNDRELMQWASERKNRAELGNLTVKTRGDPQRSALWFMQQFDPHSVYLILKRAGRANFREWYRKKLAKKGPRYDLEWHIVTMLDMIEDPEAKIGDKLKLLAEIRHLHRMAACCVSGFRATRGDIEPESAIAEDDTPDAFTTKLLKTKVG